MRCQYPNPFKRAGTQTKPSVDSDFVSSISGLASFSMALLRAATREFQKTALFFGRAPEKEC